MEISQKSTYEAPTAKTLNVKPARIVCLSGDLGNEIVGTNGVGYSDVDFD